MPRLSIEITPEEHRAIKAMALLEGSNIKEYVMQRVLPKGAQKKPSKQLEAAIKEMLTGKTKRYTSAEELFSEFY